MVESMQVGFRFSLELVEKLDAYTAKLSQETPGAKFTRADAARILITKGLEELAHTAKDTAENNKRPAKRRRKVTR
jgi:hypothetical protein